MATAASPSGNNSLQAARAAKNDEFYTQMNDVSNELRHYRAFFKGKVVYCNCDDPEWSSFYKYFQLNFELLGLAKLITTHFSLEGKPAYALELTAGDAEPLIRKIDGNGDFRSEESVALLKEADVVVTNPPFSLFREYVAQLIDHGKSFLIMGNNNAITYKEIFKLIKENKMWLGFHANKTMEFQLSPSYTKWDRVDEQGRKFGKVPAISWFTNIPHSKRNEEIILFRQYKGNETAYPKYDNYEAIEVSKVADIPADFHGAMGVPITFLDKYNPAQFEILGAMTTTKVEGYNFGYPYVGGKKVYARVIIKKRREG